MRSQVRKKNMTWKQYNSFKVYAYYLIGSVDMTVAILETSVCIECCRLALKKHAETAHKQMETIRCQDPIRAYNSIKVLHGVCQQEKICSDKKEILALA